MHKIMDKTLIYICCAIFYLRLSHITTQSTVVCLIAILAACNNTITEQIWQTFHEGKPSAVKFDCYQILPVILLLLMFFVPYSIAFLPVLLYDCYRYKYKSSLVLGILNLFWNYHILGFQAFTVLLLLCCFSILLSDYYRHDSSLKEQLILQRDTSTEHSLLLEKHNKMLRQEQDTAIYAATLQERNRIAREIHDNVGHLLTRSILQTGAILVINQDEALTEPIHALSDTLNTAMTSIRNSVHDLHDESIDLKSAICDILSTASQFEVTLDYDISNHLNTDIKYAFIAITKEAVNNCIKHSNGTKLHVLVREHPGFYQLQIEDNGTDIHIPDSTGMGITNIIERAKNMNGTAKFFTQDGFRILITVLRGEEE